ncbi:hypothetical protein NHQ30_007465 [Ciborinia camelliae]|nr:hypothetical protein NHQ30_007465 [Ciborinia camelliae]
MFQLSTLFYAVVTLGVVNSLCTKDCRHNDEKAKAVYFMTNKSPNEIVATPLGSNGYLGPPSFIPTGGNGGTATFANGKPMAPDALSSADSVVISNNYLFNVNSGSNTISMFEISPWKPTDLSWIGTYETSGDFPVSIAVHQNTICVGHSGTRSGVTCASWCPAGIDEFDQLRTLDLEYNQKTPPISTFDLHLLTDVVFTGDGLSLVATVTSSNSSSDFLSIWPVTENGIDQVGRKVSPSGTKILFGSDPIPGTSNLFISDFSFGGFTIDVNNAGVTLMTANITNQVATCWARVQADTGHGFITDGGLNNIARVDVESGDVLENFYSTNGNLANLDFQIVGNKLFALSVKNITTPVSGAVSIFDIEGEIRDFQTIHVDGIDENAQGMAVFVRSSGTSTQI